MIMLKEEMSRALKVYRMSLGKSRKMLTDLNSRE